MIRQNLEVYFAHGKHPRVNQPGVNEYAQIKQVWNRLRHFYNLNYKSVGGRPVLYFDIPDNIPKHRKLDEIVELV